MNFRQLRYFLVIADKGSFTQAAEEIPISQSSLSRHMRLLEEELGVRILIRTGRGVVLTEQGQFLCERLRSIFDQLRDTEQSLRGWYDNPSGLVRIGMPPTMTLGVAATLVRRLNERHADIRVRLSEALSATLMEWLAAERLDLAIVFEQPTNSALEAEKIGSEEVCLVIPKGYDLPNPMDIEEIARHKIIAPLANKGFWNRMADAFSQAGLEFEPAYEIDAPQAIKDLVRAGAGVAILAHSAVRRDLELGDLEIRSIASDNMRFDVFMVYSKVAQHGRAARAAASVIRETVSDFFA